MVSRAGVLALIPARGGSKSIPRKNVRAFAGHPLIAWSIAAAHAARSVGRVLVSTDDAEIRDAALAYGAECPFRRPAALAADDTPDLPVFLHALAWLERHEAYRPRLIVQLRPTSPLRPRGIVDDAVRRLLGDADADSLRAVTPAGQNPFKMWTFAPNGRLSPLMVPHKCERSEPWNTPRQALPDVYWQTGHIDVIPRRTLIGYRSMTGATVAGLVVDPRYAVDIDTEYQLRHAEWLLEHGGLDVVSPTEPTAEVGSETFERRQAPV